MITTYYRDQLTCIPLRSMGGRGVYGLEKKARYNRYRMPLNVWGPLLCWNGDNKLVLCPPSNGVYLTHSPLRDHDGGEEEFRVREVPGITPTQGLPISRYQETVTTGLTWITS